MEEQGDMWGGKFEVSSDMAGKPLRITLDWAGDADLDIHMFDPDMHILGCDYGRGAVRNTIPDATYSGPDVKPEWVEIDGMTEGTYLVAAYANESDGPVTATLRFDYEGEEDQPPDEPSNPSPANHATAVSVDADLSWTGGDPDVGDTVTYDVYFGTGATPPLVSNDQAATTYDPETLNNNTKYYWKIVATDNHAASTTGPVWDFTTEAEAGRKGDFNGDGVINIFDFVLFAAAYGSELGDDNYNPIGDFDNNDRIDIFDFVQFAAAYGT